MCLVRPCESNDGKPNIPVGHKATSSSAMSHAKDSQQSAKNQQRNHGDNKYVPIDPSDFEPRPIQSNGSIDGVVARNHPKSVHVAFKFTALASTTRTTSAAAKTSTTVYKKGKKNHPIIVVQHNYHDHSQEKEVNHPCQQKSRGGVSIPFPLKLHGMLDKAMAEGHGDIVSWQPHGRCFVVYKPQDFQSIILPKYFKLSKLSSFQRQLNLYGFQRLTFGRDRGGYYHELFLRNKEFLARDIKRIQVKGTRVRARSNPDQEPNFWTMRWCEPNVTAGSSIDESEGTSIVGIKRRMPLTWNASISLEARAGQSTLTVPILNPVQRIETKRRPDPVSSMSSMSGFCGALTNRNIDFRHHGSYTGFMNGRTEDENLMLSFGGKAFHYLDPFQPLSLKGNKSDAINEIITNAFDPGTFEHIFERI
jgi:hypothetical protein